MPRWSAKAPATTGAFTSPVTSTSASSARNECRIISTYTIAAMRACPTCGQEDIHEMTRMIQFGAVALILALAACGGDDSSSWNEEPSEPCEAVGYASHDVGSTWTTLQTVGELARDDCEECENMGEGGDIRTYETCLAAYEACVVPHQDYVSLYITENLVDRKTYRGRDVVVLETTYDEVEQEHVAGDVKVALSIDVSPHVDYIDSCTGNLVARVGESGGITDFVPHDGKLSLPLEVGKTWTATYTIGYPGGSSRVITDEWKVTSLNDVSTPAGTFMAYRIVHQDTSSYQFYYDPDLALIIKEDSSISSSYLLSYDLK